MSEVLPCGWIYATLPELVPNDGVFVDGDWVESKDQDPEGNVRLIQLADIGDGFYVNKSARFLTRQKAEELGCTFLEQGDVLVARMPDPLGRACIFPGDVKDAVTVVDVCVVRGRPDCFNERWLMYFINSSGFREKINSLQSGSTRKRISRGNLATLRLPVPPFAEQDRIVSKLEELLPELDSGIAELKSAQKKLALYRQSLLKAAVEGALTAEWRSEATVAESGEELLARILEKRRITWEAEQLKKYKEQGKALPKNWQTKYSEAAASNFGDLPSLPKGWVWATVEQLGGVQLGRQRSPDKVKGENPVRYIRAANITEAGVDLNDVLEMDFSPSEIGNFALREGDVLLTEASGSAEHVGRPAIWRRQKDVHCFQNTVIRFRPQGISAEFAFYSFLAMQKLGVFRKLSGGVGINHLSAGKFSRLPLPLPSIAEQQALVEALEAKLSACDEQSRSIEKALKQAAAQRQNILRAAFSGRLVPQDPADEPAGVLLERIRAERAAGQAAKPKGRRQRAAKEAA